MGKDEGAGTGLAPARIDGRFRELRVTTLGGDHLCDVFAEPDWTIAGVKTVIASKSHVPQYKQQLLHGTMILADAERVANLPGDEPLYLLLLLRTPQQMLDEDSQVTATIVSTHSAAVEGPHVGPWQGHEGRASLAACVDRVAGRS